MRAVTAVSLAACLLGAAADPEGIDPRDPYPNPGGPTCYGKNYDYHVWNLVAPQDVFGIDSCKTAQLLAARTVASNYAQFVSLLNLWYPKVVWPVTVMVLVWNAGTGMIQSCAAPGRGIERVQDGRTGQVLMCSAQ
jgi:hypothetical protein